MITEDPFLGHDAHSPIIFVIDDDPEIQTLLCELYRSEGYSPRSFTSALDALEKAQEADLIVCDLMLPDVSGLEFIEKLRERIDDIPVVLITAHASTETAIQALQRGALDYITKPVNLAELSVITSRALKIRTLEARYKSLKQQLIRDRAIGEMIGRSQKIQRVFDLIERVGPSNSNILITGESGTGKEMVARAVHAKSLRRHRPFIAVNCSAIPDQLLESELFGHKRGAFTGASETRRGLFEEAAGGTVFLDEIGDMPLPLQTKLLRVIQERKIKPVGENVARSIDIRLIAATHKDLKKAVREGTFREDLYYRLCVIPIELPPLRERKEDIPLLVEHFLKKHCERNGGAKKRLSKEALAKLLRLKWQGNVRELENTIERSIVLSEGSIIGPEDIYADSTPPVENRIGELFSGLMTLEQLEKEYIEYVLAETGHHKEQAAEILGINRKTLYRKERELKIKVRGLGGPFGLREISRSDQ